MAVAFPLSERGADRSNPFPVGLPFSLAFLPPYPVRSRLAARRTLR